jgi:exopolysaccharide production protein ExoY
MSASEYDADFVGASSNLAIPPALRLVVDNRTRSAPLRYHGWERYIKRGMDIAVTLLALPFALPIMAVIALAIRRDSEGPAIFKQERMGQNGRPFRMLKFRTMHVDSEERLAADPELYATYVAHDFKVPNDQDPRVTRVGRFLRYSSLDELPQLFNVLRGSMSLVGPRPILLEQLMSTPEAIPSYVQLRPGLTGRWQVEGRNFVQYPERAELDREYLENWTVRSDLWILLRTVPLVLKRRGCQ